jgi:hypothetical protein
MWNHQLTVLFLRRLGLIPEQAVFFGQLRFFPYHVSFSQNRQQDFLGKISIKRNVI